MASEMVQLCKNKLLFACMHKFNVDSPASAERVLRSSVNLARHPVNGAVARAFRGEKIKLESAQKIAAALQERLCDLITASHSEEEEKIRDLTGTWIGSGLESEAESPRLGYRIEFHLSHEQTDKSCITGAGVVIEDDFQSEKEQTHFEHYPLSLNGKLSRGGDFIRGEYRYDSPDRLGMGMFIGQYVSHQKSFIGKFIAVGDDRPELLVSGSFTLTKVIHKS